MLPLPLKYLGPDEFEGLIRRMAIARFPGARAMSGKLLASLPEAHVCAFAEIHEAAVNLGLANEQVHRILQRRDADLALTTPAPASFDLALYVMGRLENYACPLSQAELARALNIAQTTIKERAAEARFLGDGSISRFDMGFAENALDRDHWTDADKVWFEEMSCTDECCAILQAIGGLPEPAVLSFLQAEQIIAVTIGLVTTDCEGPSPSTVRHLLSRLPNGYGEWLFAISDAIDASDMDKLVRARLQGAFSGVRILLAILEGHSD